ncbi:MAG: GTP-binding protein [Cyanobacteria bacterium P01_G01_bin.67]
MDTSIQGIPVSIITGFLGSGKTTLLNHILTQQQGLKTAVLVNEFGEIGIDNELIIKSDDDIVELNNGCICCTINEDLVKTVHKILERKEKLDYLIVETTGVADPVPVAVTFLSGELRGKTRLDSIITVVDCDNFYAEAQKNSTAAYQQITHGDIILLNKTDLAESETVDRIEEQIRQHRGDAKVIRIIKGEVALPLILSVGLFESDRYFPEEISYSHHHEHEHNHEHHHHSDHLDEDGFTSLSFETEQPLDIRKFQYFLDNQLPESVFRAKGILWLKGSPARHIFHLSGKRFGIEDDKWKGTPKNQLVFIGQNLEPEKLKGLLEGCVC